MDRATGKAYEIIIDIMSYPSNNDETTSQPTDTRDDDQCQLVMHHTPTIVGSGLDHLMD